MPKPMEESQRDSDAKPRVARNELPWVRDNKFLNRNAVVADSLLSRHAIGRDPVGVEGFWRPVSQGSSFLATLGSKMQSLWDWPKCEKRCE